MGKDNGNHYQWGDIRIGPYWALSLLRYSAIGNSANTNSRLAPFSIRALIASSCDARIAHERPFPGWLSAGIALRRMRRIFFGSWPVISAMSAMLKIFSAFAFAADFALVFAAVMISPFLDCAIELLSLAVISLTLKDTREH